MIVNNFKKNKKIIAIPPWETLMEVIYYYAVKEMSLSKDLTEEQIEKLLLKIRNREPITEIMAEQLEYLGLCNSKFWLNLQKVYDEKIQKIG